MILTLRKMKLNLIKKTADALLSLSQRSNFQVFYSALKATPWCVMSQQAFMCQI